MKIKFPYIPSYRAIKVRPTTWREASDYKGAEYTSFYEKKIVNDITIYIKSYLIADKFICTVGNIHHGNVIEPIDIASYEVSYQKLNEIEAQNTPKQIIYRQICLAYAELKKQYSKWVKKLYEKDV